MTQRGRKSVTAQAVKSAEVVSIPRAAPPAELSDFEAARWADVVATKPSDWFTKDVECLLLSYVKHMTHATNIDRQIEALDRETEKAGFPGVLDIDFIKLQEKLYLMRERESKALTNLATKMRLAQQSRIHAEKAGRKTDNHITGRKPWERIT